MSSNAWTTFSCSTCDLNIKYLKLTNFCQLNVFVNLQGKYEWISRSLLPLVHSSSPKLEPLAITILFVHTLCTLLWHCCSLPAQRHSFQVVVHFVKTAGHRSRYWKNCYHAFRWNSITYPHLYCRLAFSRSLVSGLPSPRKEFWGGARAPFTNSGW